LASVLTRFATGAGNETLCLTDFCVVAMDFSLHHFAPHCIIHGACRHRIGLEHSRYFPAAPFLPPFPSGTDQFPSGRPSVYILIKRNPFADREADHQVVRHARRLKLTDLVYSATGMIAEATRGDLLA